MFVIGLVARLKRRTIHVKSFPSAFRQMGKIKNEFPKLPQSPNLLAAEAGGEQNP
jgi:hypothetical protein